MADDKREIVGTEPRGFIEMQSEYGKEMDETGMSDLQFKSFLKQLVGRMEGAMNEPTEKEAKAKLGEIIRDLKSDIDG